MANKIEVNILKRFLCFPFTITKSHDNSICKDIFHNLKRIKCTPLSKASFENNTNLSSSADLLASVYVTSSAVIPELDIDLAKANLGGTVSSTSRENTRNIVSKTFLLISK